MVTNSTVSDNTADWGGGLYNRGVPTLERSTISGNSAAFDGGGLLSFETLSLIDTTVADNVAGQSGGGIANEAGSLEVGSSTVSGNGAAAAGGGVYNPSGAAAALVNTTISGNSANSGGGIYTAGALQLTSGTMADNAAPSASAIYDPGTSDAAPRSISSSLIRGDCAGSPFDSGGFNIESPGDTCGFDEASDQPAEQTLSLGPLQDNGGPTLTHALAPSSVAVDRIPEADCVDAAGMPLPTDQRGEPRPAGAGAACDVGAFELQP
jgi:predicted outer membrane repeat protein